MERGAMARVLLVDDDGDVLDVVEQGLAEEGYEVTAVESGEDARECLRQGDYDAAVIDYVMPREDGLSLAQFVRSKGIPVVIITGAIELDDLRGHDLRLVRKPFSSADLGQAIRAVLEASARSASRDR
jgi:two-component system, OmpR family, response regulator